MEQKRKVLVTVKGTKTRHTNRLDITPLKILVSTQTGRRYVCAGQRNSRRLGTFRLDSIQSVELLEPDDCYDNYMSSFEHIFPYVWGVSFGSFQKQEPESISMKIQFDEKEEDFILTRLEREGRGGTLKRVKPGLYEYICFCLDAMELLPWAKSFTGRVCSFHCSNPSVEKRFWNDIQLMESYYLTTGEYIRHENQ